MKKLIPLLLAWALVACTEKNPVLTVSGGSLVGAQLPGEKVYVYKGIPYAAPPVGELRWKAPQPVIPWEGVREALEFGHPAMQAPHTPGGYTPEFFFDGDPAFNEDCLTLNIWTSRPGKPEAGMAPWRRLRSRMELRTGDGRCRMGAPRRRDGFR